MCNVCPVVPQRQFQWDPSVLFVPDALHCGGKHLFEKKPRTMRHQEAVGVIICRASLSLEPELQNAAYIDLDFHNFQYLSFEPFQYLSLEPKFILNLS